MSEQRKAYLSYVNSPGYTTGVATSMTVTGPTGDGMLHFHFVRDMQRPTREEFDTQIVHSEDGSLVGEQMMSAGPADVENYKEIIASMSVPFQLAGNIGQALLDLANRLGVQAQSTPIESFKTFSDGKR